MHSPAKAMSLDQVHARHLYPLRRSAGPLMGCRIEIRDDADTSRGIDATCSSHEASGEDVQGGNEAAR